MTYSITYPSVFSYSQKHIITKVIPQLLAERNSLLIGGEGITKEDVEALAKKQKRILYFYKGDDHTDAAVGKFGVDYEPCFPSEASKKVFSNEIANYNGQIIKWINLIATNELQKVRAINDPNGEVSNYSFSAGQNVSFSEQIAYTIWTRRAISTSAAISTPMTLTLTWASSSMARPNRMLAHRCRAIFSPPLAFICLVY